MGQQCHLTVYKEKLPPFSVSPPPCFSCIIGFVLAFGYVSRNYKPMPPLWRIQELLELSDEYPSGLKWRIKKACNAAGSQAGRLNRTTGYYMVSIDNEYYLAHRVVYYLHTNEDPCKCDVVHEYHNKDKDNRKELTAKRVFIKKNKVNTEPLSSLF